MTDHRTEKRKVAANKPRNLHQDCVPPTSNPTIPKPPVSSVEEAANESDFVTVGS